MSREEEQERQDYIADKEQALNDLQSQIQQLRTRLQREGDLVSAQERADWDQKLFELEQQRQDLQARLQRAKTATPEQWKAMRGNIKLTFDRIEAGVKTAGARLKELFTRRESERQPVRGIDDAGAGMTPAQ